jgi:hypothetical protein
MPNTDFGDVILRQQSAFDAEPRGWVGGSEDQLSRKALVSGKYGSN